MSVPTIALKTSARDYAALVNLGNRAVTSLTGNLAYATPVPALMSVQTDITAVENALAVWNPLGNRGSHDDLVDLRAKAITLHQTLKSLAAYVESTASNASGNNFVAMAAMISTSGFELRSAKTPQGKMQMVQNFHLFISRKLSKNQVKIKWKKPLNTTSLGNVKSYNVYRATTPVFATAVVVANITQTSFIDTNAGAAPITWSYWIAPVNNFMVGVVSDAVTATVQNA